jgi:glyoxylase-like metal-dependent hydrolase (beta-lactamase superfamily II)
VIFDFSTPDTKAFAKQVSTASLGDHSYIVVVNDEAAAIDIQRDLDRFEDVLVGVDARLTAVLETHIHNDYVSGGKRLADAHRAAHVLPANTGAPYDHTPCPMERRSGSVVGLYEGGRANLRARGAQPPR